MGKKGKTIQIVLDGSSSSESESEHEDDGRVSPPFQIGLKNRPPGRNNRGRRFERADIDQMGVHNWVENMFHMIETGEVDEHSAHYINLAHEMIKRFSAVVFMKEKERLGRKASNLIRKVRTKHNIREDEALEVTIDRTRAARKVYRDLLKITGIRDLPQVFVNETFIGSWQDLKTLHKTGFKDLFCPICAETGGKHHESHKDRVKNF
ncbi:hypothetical protein ACHWQZ_G015088 [Mnemiopsis leidyi]